LDISQTTNKNKIPAVINQKNPRQPLNNITNSYQESTSFNEDSNMTPAALDINEN
jgi:hypothetical protein